MSMILNWHRSGYQLSAEQLAEISEKLLTKPLIHS